MGCFGSATAGCSSDSLPRLMQMKGYRKSPIEEFPIGLLKSGKALVFSLTDSLGA